MSQHPVTVDPLVHADITQRIQDLVYELDSIEARVNAASEGIVPRINTKLISLLLGSAETAVKAIEALTD